MHAHFNSFLVAYENNEGEEKITTLRAEDYITACTDFRQIFKGLYNKYRVMALDKALESGLVTKEQIDELELIST